MRKLVIITVTALVLFGCLNQSTKKQPGIENKPVDVEQTAYTIDELYKNAVELADKEVAVKGLVMHVCKHGGERCFLMGSNEDINIRIEAGEKIGAFSQEMMGSELIVTGVLKEVKTEADAHNPGKEHGETHEGEDAETVDAHKSIAESQEAAETVYFIEGMKIVKEI